MGAQVRYGTIAIGAYSAHQPGSHQRAFTDQYYPKWDRGGARSPRTVKDPNRWYSLWSFGCRVGSGAPIGSDGAGWYDLSMKDLFEPYSCDGDGCQHIKWLKGLCVDASDVPIASAVIESYTTLGRLFGGTVFANVDGTYTVPTPYAGLAHFVVAYKPGAPDIGGTTVNTLVPTNIDGS